MSTLTDHHTLGQLSFCQNCGRNTIVRGFRHPLNTDQILQLCFICGNVPGAILDRDNKPVFAALSLLLDTIKPPKKPKQPKADGPAVHPMRPRK